MIETLPALNQKRGTPGMAKPPFFPFYYQDFFQGTKHFSPAQRGVYLEMICDCWELGIIKEKHFAHLKAGLLPGEFEEILGKFIGVKGGFKHKKVETIRESVNSRSEIARRNGLLGGRPKKANEKLEDNLNESQTVSKTEAENNLLKSQILNLKAQIPNSKDGELREKKPPIKSPNLDPLRKKEWPTFFKLTESRKKFALEQGIVSPDKVWLHWKLYVKANGVLKTDWDAAWEVWCLDERTRKGEPEGDTEGGLG